MNPDLARERSKASFDVEELIYLLDGGRERTERRRYLESLLSKEPLFNKEKNFFCSREDFYKLATERAIRLLQIRRENNITDRYDINMLGRGVDNSLPTSLQESMFLPTLKMMASKEQQAKWLPLAESCQMVGTYAQTELGHGTFIRGLETTATYDKKTQEFILNSPTLSACKWWPGNLGHSTNHCFVIARLIIDGKEYGTNYFLLQTRDYKTHQPCPGVTIGDIGPKACLFYNANDNGFLLLDHVRIPRDNMLMGMVQVSPDGTFTRKSSKSGNSKAGYAPMIYVRAGIPFHTFYLLSRAITVAIRYSAVRRQSEIKPGHGEVQIMDYKTQQDKLLPGLAMSYAFRFASLGVMLEYGRQNQKWSRGDYSNLQELHSLTSGLKAFTTNHALQQADICRLACGGHGYSMFSDLPEAHNHISAACTYEGENTVLLLQVARFLLKCLSTARSGAKLHETVSYLSEPESYGPSWVACGEEFLDPRVQLHLFRDRSHRLVNAVEAKIQLKVKSGMDPAVAFNALSVDLVRCANAHTMYLIVKYFIDALNTSLAGASKAITSALKNQSDLYALYGIMDDSGSFLETGLLSAKQVSVLRDQVMTLLGKIRPDAVALVDAFDYSDFVLNSALGRYDGQVYQRLFELAQKSQLNKHPVQPSAHKYLQELRKAKL